MVRLYRSVSDAEYQNWRTTHRFTTIPGSVEGKWFAFTREHAMKWGRWFERKNQRANDKIIAVDVPDDLFAKFEPKLKNLDGIGAACFAPIQVLEEIVFDEVTE